MATSPYVPGSTAWYRWMETRQQQHHVDIQRLWNRVDQSPQQWAGMWQHQEYPPVDPTSTTQPPCNCSETCLKVQMDGIGYSGATGSCAEIATSYTCTSHELPLSLGGPLGVPVTGNKCGNQVGGAYKPVEDGQVQIRVEVNVGFDNHVHKWKMAVRVYSPKGPDLGAPEGSFYSHCYEDAGYECDTCTGTYTKLIEYDWHTHLVGVFPSTIEVTGTAGACPTTTGPSTTAAMTTTQAPCGGDCEWQCMEIWSGPWWVVTNSNCTPVDEFGNPSIPGCTCGSGPFTGGPCSSGELGDTRTEPCGIDGTTSPPTSTSTTIPPTTNGTTGAMTTTLPPTTTTACGAFGCTYIWTDQGTGNINQGVWVQIGNGCPEGCTCGPTTGAGSFFGQVRNFPCVAA